MPSNTLKYTCNYLKFRIGVIQPCIGDRIRSNLSGAIQHQIEARNRSKLSGAIQFWIRNQSRGKLSGATYYWIGNRNSGKLSRATQHQIKDRNSGKLSDATENQIRDRNSCKLIVIGLVLDFIYICRSVYRLIVLSQLINICRLLLLLFIQLCLIVTKFLPSIQYFERVCKKIIKEFLI